MIRYDNTYLLHSWTDSTWLKTMYSNILNKISAISINFRLRMLPHRWASYSTCCAQSVWSCQWRKTYQNDVITPNKHLTKFNCDGIRIQGWPWHSLCVHNMLWGKGGHIRLSRNWLDGAVVKLKSSGSVAIEHAAPPVLYLVVPY